MQAVRSTPAAQDPVASALARAPIVSLRVTQDLRLGRIEARITLDDGTSRRAVLIPAHRDRPLIWRRPLAFYRLAHAIGARVVPAAAPRRFSFGELAALFDAAHVAPKDSMRALPVLNDGMVDALLIAPAPGPPGPRWEAPPSRRRVIVLDEEHEVKRWATWAASPAPAPGERTSLVRDYIEAIALDYLAGHVQRRVITLDADAGALILERNAAAFPPHVPAHALDRFLHRLAAVARFPRSLRDGLARLGPTEAAAALAPGAMTAPIPEGFDDWLVPPRVLVELDERRVTLITLIQAEIDARGEAAVLSL